MQALCGRRRPRQARGAGARCGRCPSNMGCRRRRQARWGARARCGRCPSNMGCARSHGQLPAPPLTSEGCACSLRTLPNRVGCMRSLLTLPKTWGACARCRRCPKHGVRVRLYQPHDVAGGRVQKSPNRIRTTAKSVRCGLFETE